MNTENNIETKATHLIEFQGVTMAVVVNNGIEYVSGRTLVDLTGVDWRKARKTLFSDDNATLYGTKELIPPVFDEIRDPRVTKKVVYIRLDRSIMFLSRVNTSQMRANGKEDAADALLKLQIEWAEALHSYETTGMAFKANHAKVESSQLKDLLAVSKEKRSTADTGDRKMFGGVMKDIAEKIGHPYQEDLEDIS